MKNNNKTDLIIYVLGIISIILIILGTPFLFFNYKKQASNDNIIITSDVTFIYEEDKQDTEIQIENKYPILDDIDYLISDNSTCIYELKPVINLYTDTTVINNDTINLPWVIGN